MPKPKRKRRGGRIYQIKKLKRTVHRKIDLLAKVHKQLEQCDQELEQCKSEEPQPKPRILSSVILRNAVPGSPAANTPSSDDKIAGSSNVGTTSWKLHTLEYSPCTEDIEWKLQKIDLTPDVGTTWIPPYSIPLRDPRRATYLKKRAQILHELHGAATPSATPIITLGGDTPVRADSPTITIE